MLHRIINNDLEIHKQVKTNEIKFQRFSDFMTPLSRNDLMNTVRVKKSSGQINLHKGSQTRQKLLHGWNLIVYSSTVLAA